VNTSIRKVAAAIGVLLVALFVNLNYVQVVKGNTYRNAQGNRRVLLNEYASPRGQINVGGAPIAESKATKDELKYLRIYPHGPVYAPLTGFYSIDATPSRFLGTEGIEEYEDAVLSGSDERLFGRRLADILTGRNPRGGSVELTVDPSAQQTAYDELTRAHLKGAVVALDPTTGAILAAVSTPSYDPNKLSSHNSDEIASAYNAYCRPNGQNNCANPDEPLQNRDFNKLYFPGSIFKIVVSAAALKSGNFTPTSVIQAPNGYLPTTGTNVSSCKGDVRNCVQNFQGETCANGHTATLAFAFAKSCNTAFSELVDDNLDPSALAAEAKLFGFDPSSQLTIPMGVANSTIGPPSDLLDRGKLAHIAFGQQSVQVTPLQAAMLSAAVANGGVLMRPYVVNRELAPDLTQLSKTSPSQLSQVLNSQQDQQLQSMMEGVVSQPEGTAHDRFLGITGYTIGAKTGTADVGATSASNLAPDAWFTGYATSQSTGAPRIAVAVILEGASSGNESAGGRLAGPIARDVMAAYLKANPNP
jgi:peptidoglycan glycosyltransferase